ncbi:right-handed parallel beta-helix repeat-containing protein [Candidatus Bathyarchaeota archaeon]|nr:right-handed parallel beta-helix repeat-containing protein [Candidatus Bathyarchaeota archaeon]
MSKRTVSGIMLTILSIGMLTLAFNVPQSFAFVRKITVPDDYPTIQEAIIAANSGDTVFVKNGTYYENVVVNKTVSLVGECKCNTVIDGNLTGTVVNVTASNVKITGFTVQNSGSSMGPIWDVGIYVAYSSGNNISHNIVMNNREGIRLFESSNSIMSGNNITDNGSGISLWNSDHHIVSGNNIANNGVGLVLAESPSFGRGRHAIFENNITTNSIGILIGGTSRNNIFHNTFINPAKQFTVLASEDNTWDSNGEGNYWSDYNGTDSDGDGIGDTPYTINQHNQDNYPLMSPYWYWKNPMVGDLNRDMKIDIKDIAIAAKAFGSYPGHPNWNPHADITGPTYLVPDGKIDIRDIALIAIHYGEVYP